VKPKGVEHRGLFITATDTDAGKTEVTAAIARLWRREARPFAVCKPVATGARADSAGGLADDTRRLAKAAGDDDTQAITPFVFAEPAAPPVAAKAAGRTLHLDDLVGAVERRRLPGTALLVEGVGGLLCPLTDRHTVADLAGRLNLPLAIVARRSLGTINHTLLTIEAARNRRLEVVGLVITETTRPGSLAEQTCIDELRRRVDVPILAVVPHRPGGYEEEIQAISQVDWWSLAR